MGDGMVHHPGEWDGSVHEVVLVRPVGVALAVRVVLVHADLLTWWQQPPRRLHRTGQYDLAGLVVEDGLPHVGALRPGILRVGVVHVVAGAVGQHRVDQVCLHIGCHLALPYVAARVRAPGDSS